MKNLTKFIILLIIFKSSNLQCAEGCLKCSTDDTCMLCDSTKSFKEVSGKCELVIHENCVASNQTGDCLACNLGFYIEANSRKCIAVDKAIENCAFYDSTQSCKICLTNFYIDGNVCKAVEKQVANCQIYILDEQCMACEDGYVMNFDSKTCTPTSSVTGCSQFSRVKCEKCAPNYIKNENLYFKSLFKFTSLAEKDVVLSLIGKEGLSDLTIERLCEQTSLTDCLEFTTFNRCKICTVGFFLLDDGKCQKFPLPVILNCQRYSSFSTCIECANQFYLKNSTNCSAVTDIDNCSEYNGSASTTQCLTCKDEYYLSGSTSCKLRVNIIDKCDNLNADSDSCFQCAANFEKTSDSLKCLPIVAKCIEYSSSSKTDLKLVCTACQAGCILDKDECKDGTITGCAAYTPSSTFSSQVCAKCNNQFFLVDNKCTQMTPIDKCLTYHGTKDKSCLVCEKGYFNFLINNKCKSLTAILNCLTYTPNVQPLTCSTCISGYIPNDTKTACNKILVENCSSGTDVNTCTICKTDYALTGTKCSAILDHTGKNCQVSNINSKNDSEVRGVVCQQCKINSLPIENKDLSVCIKNENLPIYFTSITSVNNCTKYSDAGLCISCLEGKYYKNNNCFDTCDEVIERYNFTSKTRNNCIDTAGTCKIKAPYINATGNGCFKCSTGNVFTVVLNENYYTNVTPDIGPDIISNPRAVFLNGTCVAETGKSFNFGTSSASSAQIANCLYYKARATDVNKLDCITCKDYSTGVIENETSIVSCVLDTDFVEGSKKYGLDPIWEKFFSAYECKGSGKIPFVAYRATLGSPSQIIGFNPSDQPFNGTLRKSNFCNLDRADQTANQNIAVLENCGMGAYEVAPTTNVATFKCAACKPGYKPGASDVIFKTSCTLIPNCTGTSWFNSCSQCATNFVFLFTAASEIDYTTCTAYSKNLNCYASDATGICKVCKKGFVLNAEGICDSYTSPNCASSTSFNLQNTEIIAESNPNYKAYTYFKFQDVIGCGTCKTGYTLAVINYSLNLCIESDYIKTKSNEIASTSPFIQYCESYSKDGTGFKCFKCKAGQLLVNSNNKCVPEIADCEIASDTANQCKICKVGYALKNNVCVEGKIENCESYYNSDNKTDLICKSCKDGFFLATNDTVCVATYVQNCQYPQSLKKCNDCAAGYILYTENNFDYCYPKDNNYQCDSASIETNAEYGADITCDSCSLINEVFVTDIDNNIPVKTICMAYDPIDNCKTISVAKTLDLSTFHCTECNDDYYLDINTLKCLERTNKPSDCVSYSLTDDFCILCSSTTFIENGGKTCTSFPVGIVGCNNYTNATSCTGCVENMFLSGKSCEKVEDANLVSNCIYYQNGTICKQCKDNYFLNNNTCTKANVNNCLKIKSADICEICKDGYGIKETAGKTDCVSVTQSKCLSFTPKDPFPCILCDVDYYPDVSGKCVKANPLITDCQIYKSIDICNQCKQGSVLALDKKSCIKGNVSGFIAQSCTAAFITTPFCVVCSAGMYLNNGACVACQKNGASTGCFACDPSNDEACLVCNTDYYMNKEGSCISTLPPPVIVDDTTNRSQRYFVYAFTFFFMLM